LLCPLTSDLLMTLRLLRRSAREREAFVEVSDVGVDVGRVSRNEAIVGCVRSLSSQQGSSGVLFGGGGVALSGGNPVTFGSVLAVREFRALWLAELFSVCGDQLARVALAVLVFDRTGSAALTGLTYALTFVPTFLGGVLLSGWGDRQSRRDVMVITDVARMLAVAAMVIPGMPLWALCVFVAAMAALGGPFKAAQQALLPDVLQGEQYMVGMALRNVTSQSAQLAGFGAGGLAVAAVGPSTGLLLDAGTFAISALLLRIGVQRRPPTPSSAATGTRAWLASIGTGFRLVWRDPALRALVALNWLAAFYVVPEALAAPYAAGIGAGTAAVGWLMAADPVGSVIGGVLFGKWVPEQVQVKVIGLLGILAGVPLIVCALKPGLVVTMVLLALSGMLATGYNIQGTTSFMRRLPPGQRAQGAGMNSTGLITVQGLGVAAAGVLAQAIGPAHAIAVSGLVGALLAIPIALGWSRARGGHPDPHTSRSERWA
jgi:MFS family permease